METRLISDYGHVIAHGQRARARGYDSAPITASMRFFIVSASNGLMM